MAASSRSPAANSRNGSKGSPLRSPVAFLSRRLEYGHSPSPPPGAEETAEETADETAGETADEAAGEADALPLREPQLGAPGGRGLHQDARAPETPNPAAGHPGPRTIGRRGQDPGFRAAGTADRAHQEPGTRGLRLQRRHGDGAHCPPQAPGLGRRHCRQSARLGAGRRGRDRRARLHQFPPRLPGARAVQCHPRPASPVPMAAPMAAFPAGRGWAGCAAR